MIPPIKGQFPKWELLNVLILNNSSAYGQLFTPPSAHLCTIPLILTMCIFISFVLLMDTWVVDLDPVNH